MNVFFAIYFVLLITILRMLKKIKLKNANCLYLRANYLGDISSGVLSAESIDSDKHFFYDFSGLSVKRQKIQ